MRNSFTINGVPVSGKNSQRIAVNRRTGQRFTLKSKAAAAWQQNAIAQLTQQRTGKRRHTLAGPVYVEYVAYQATDRCDIDNIEAALFDALRKAQVIEDDKLIVDHHGRKAIDRANPRIEVTVQAASQ